MQGLEQLPWAEVWFHEVDEGSWRAASARARALGKTGLEAWTTDGTPAVVEFLRGRGYEEVRRYVISELDVESAPDPAAPAFPLVTLAERPSLAEALFTIARESYCDQPGRSEQRIESFDVWRSWARPAPGRSVLRRPRGRGRARLRLPRRRGRGRYPRVHGSGEGSARPWCRRRHPPRPDRLGEGPRRAQAEDGERDAARRHARAQPPLRLPAALRGDRPPRPARSTSGVRRRRRRGG